MPVTPISRFVECLKHSLSSISEIVRRRVKNRNVCQTQELEDVRLLSELKPSEKATIVAVHEDDPTMLRYLMSLGMIPDVCIRVDEVAPFGGPLIVCVSGSRYALGREVASNIRVK